jgi:hypothetical protein
MKRPPNEAVEKREIGPTVSGFEGASLIASKELIKLQILAK